MHLGHRIRHQAIASLRGLAIVLPLTLAINGVALAQGMPPPNEGPRFGSWGPGAAPPSPEGFTAPPGVPAPGGGVGVPPPVPGNVCFHDLRGNWRVTGVQDVPYHSDYTVSLVVQQYGHWLQIQQPQGDIVYYGVCRGNSIELDVYENGQFAGYENGTVVNDIGPWRAGRVRLTWTTFVPQYSAGHERWLRYGYQ